MVIPLIVISMVEFVKTFEIPSEFFLHILFCQNEQVLPGHTDADRILVERAVVIRKVRHSIY